MNITKRDRIYLSGQITGTDYEKTRRRFKAMQDTLEALYGCEVFNPFSMDEILTVSKCSRDSRLIPGCNIGRASSSGKPTYKCFLRHDIGELFECSWIAMMKGWQDSPGACAELAVASALGIKVAFEGANLEKYMKDGKQKGEQVK